MQLQPTVRWLWHAAEETSVWASVARAVRTPSLEVRDIVQRFDPGGVPDDQRIDASIAMRELDAHFVDRAEMGP